MQLEVTLNHFSYAEYFCSKFFHYGLKLLKLWFEAITWINFITLILWDIDA